MNAAERRKRRRDVAPQTTKELVQLGHDIRAAESAEREREVMDRRVQRQREGDKRLVARLDPTITALEADVSAKQSMVDRLNQERAELAARIEASPTPAAQDSRDLEDIEAALTQAMTDGAEVHRGVSVHEGGGTTPMQVRVPHPRLVEADPDVDWTYGIEPLQRHLAELKTERDAAARRLDAVAA